MCSLKTMIKIAFGIGLLLIIGYLALPQYHANVDRALSNSGL